MVVSELRDAKGCMVYEITLGRTEVERASREGLKVPRDKLRHADDVVIKIGPDVEESDYKGVATLVDQSTNCQIQEVEHD